MTHEPCASRPVVEALRDGRLAERDAASLERHMVACEECTRFAADLAELRTLVQGLESPPSPLASQRARVRLLRAAAGSHARTRPRLPLVLAVAVLLSAVAAVVSASTAPSVLLARSFALDWIDGVDETSVRPLPGASYTREREGATQRIALETGGVDVSVRRLAPAERFVVLTADAEVEVRGTRFRVEAERAKLVGVTVFEGTVEIRRGGTRTLVAAGERWQASPPAQAGLAAAASPAPMADEAARPRTRAPLRAAPSPNGSDLRASERFRAAMHAMEQGDYAAASNGLQQFADDHPQDARAEDAAFLAILALERAGRQREAAAAARRYLLRFPDGFRRAEAARIARE